MKATRRLLAAALAALAGAAMLTPASPVRAQTVPTQTVRMWTFLNPAGNAPRERALASMIQRFETANPGTRIVVEQQVWSQLTPKFLAAHSANNAPDIVWVENDQLGEVIRAGALSDLNAAFIDKWPPAKVEERRDALWNRCTDAGRVRCLVLSRNYISVVYRADYLREAGIDPATLTTWDKFHDAAKRLTVKDAAGAVTRWGFGQQFSENQADPQLMVAMMLGRQPSIFRPDGQANFATDAGVEALRFQTDLVTKDGVTPRQAVGWTVEDMYDQFAAGRLAMITGGSVRVSTLQAKVGAANVGLMLWPSADGAKPSPGLSAGWSVAIWQGSRQKEAAAKFVEMMTDATSDRLWVEVGGQLPFVPSLLDGMPEFSAKPEGAPLRVAAQGVSSASWVTPISHTVAGYRQVLNRAAQQVITNGADPKAALQEAERAFNRQNSR